VPHRQLQRTFARNETKDARPSLASNSVGELKQINAVNETNGGWGGIRTHGTLARTAVFKTAAFNRSATHPIDNQTTPGTSASQVLTKGDFHHHV
jgi:hypothetical protein